MVQLVFCPWRQLKLGASTHHLPGLVEHAKSEGEGEVEPPGPGVMEQEQMALARLPRSAWTQAVRGTGVEAPGRGRQAAPQGGPTGLGQWAPGPRWAEACRSLQELSHTWLACLRAEQ